MRKNNRPKTREQRNRLVPPNPSVAPDSLLTSGNNVTSQMKLIQAQKCFLFVLKLKSGHSRRSSPLPDSQFFLSKNPYHNAVGENPISCEQKTTTTTLVQLLLSLKLDAGQN